MPPSLYFHASFVSSSPTGPTGPCLTMTLFVSRDAWYDQKNLSRTEAKRRYITVLIGVMRKYASSTPEAGELISELEFVWDQVRDNTAPQHGHRTRGRQQANNPQPRRIAANVNNNNTSSNIKNNENATAGARPETGAAASQIQQENSHLRVLSPHSQKRPDSYTEGEDEDDGEEGEDTFEEARDSFYEDNEDDEYGNYNSYYDNPIAGFQSLPIESQNAPGKIGNNSNSMARVPTYGPPRKPSGADRNDLPDPANPPHQQEGRLTRPGVPDRRWRRDVGHALNQITTELAAIREQMEAQTRGEHLNRWRWRPKSVWSVARYAASFVFSHVCWDMAILIVVLLAMRARGDLRLEEKLKEGWARLRRKFPAVRFYIRQFRKFRFLAL